VQRELSGIVGFEVLVEQVEAGYKLSQNRNEADFASIVAELEKLRAPDAARLARARQEFRHPS